MTAAAAIGWRENFRRDVALDAAHRPAFAERHLGLEKLAIEMLRGAAVNRRLKRLKPLQNLADNVGHSCRVLYFTRH